MTPMPPSALPVRFLMGEFEPTFSGGGRSLLLILRHLDRISGTVHCPDRFAPMIREAVPGLEIRPLPIREEAHALLARGTRANSLIGNVRLLGGLIQANFRMARSLWSGGAAVVHCNSIYDFLLGGVGARLANARVVLNIRATTPSTDAKLRWHWQAAFLLASDVIVLSRAMRDYYVRGAWAWTAPALCRKIRFIYSGIELDRIPPPSPDRRRAARERLGLPPGAPLIGYVGELSPRKGQLEFIRFSLPELRRLLPGARVVFLGGVPQGLPEYRRACEQAVQESGLGDTVMFMGHIPDVSPWYEALDLTTLASRFEGVPRVFIESLAHGVPVVCTDFTSAREVLEENGAGIVVGSEDFAGLARALADLASSPERRAALRKNGLECVARCFDIGRVAAQYEEIYLKERMQ